MRRAPTTGAHTIGEIGAQEFARMADLPRSHRRRDTYSYPPNLAQEQACAMWTGAPSRCFTAERDGVVLGLYMLRPNQPGVGDHVANCGYMVAAHVRGQGVASAMCDHSLAQARRSGYRAMQYNFVFRSNEGAVRLAEARLRHPRLRARRIPPCGARAHRHLRHAPPVVIDAQVSAILTDAH